MDYTDFIVKQQGRDLTLLDSSKIVINKYDNKVTRIVFEFDETIPGRYYFAMKNPVTGKYRILPIINNHMVIGTGISSYPGTWSSILIVVDEQSEIINDDIDETQFTFVSNTFSRIVVRNNFLNEEDIEDDDDAMFPIINEILDNLVKAQDRLENASIAATEAAASAKADREIVEELMKDINKANENIAALEGYIEYITNARDEVLFSKNEVAENVAHVNGVLTEVKKNLTTIEITATHVLEYKESIEKTVDDCVDYIENNKQMLLDAYNQYIQDIKDEANNALADINTIKESVDQTIESGITSIDTAKSDALSAIKNAKDDYEETVTHEKQSAIDAIQTESELQQELIADKGQEVLDSITNNSSPNISIETINSAISSYLIENPIIETDPTVPSWAKQPNKPIYTASEVGAEPTGTAETKVSTHNVSTEAHNDLRILLTELSAKVTNLLNSDDETLDQTKEIVDYIKANRTLIESVTTVKVNVDDIITNLTTNVDNKVLAASQGVVLKQLIDTLQATLNAELADILLRIVNSLNEAKTYTNQEVAKKSAIQIITWEDDD